MLRRAAAFRELFVEVSKLDVFAFAAAKGVFERHRRPASNVRQGIVPASFGNVPAGAREHASSR